MCLKYAVFFSQQDGVEDVFEHREHEESFWSAGGRVSDSLTLSSSSHSTFYLLGKL